MNIFIYTLLVCLGVCLYPINVKTAEPIGPKFFCGISRKSREGLWMIKFSKICLHQNSTFETFENPRNYSYKIREENMFAMEMRDGRPYSLVN